MDKFLEKIPVGHHDLIRALDDLIMRAVPALRSSIKWGNLTYRYHQNICAIVSHKYYINLQFWNGNHLNDPQNLLTGTGKNMRHIRISNIDDLEPEYIVQLVRQAVDLESKGNWFDFRPIIRKEMN